MSIDIPVRFENVTWHVRFEVERQMEFVKHTHWCQWIMGINYIPFFLIWLQATLSPPVTGKMFKGLLVCYSVVTSTFFSVASSGYWAYGNSAAGNLFTSLAPDIPSWLTFLANMLILAQLFAVALVSGHKIKRIVECFFNQCWNAYFLEHTLA